MLVRRRFLGSRAVVLVILSLLFSQLALAAYVCPGVATPTGMAERMAAGLPCEPGADEAQPVLCHQHAIDPSRLFEVAHAAAPSLPAVVHVLLIPVTPDMGEALELPPASTAEARPPPDPLFLATLRLRV